MTTAFKLGRLPERATIAAAFRSTGRVEIPTFLAPGQADLLRAHLIGREDWTLVMNAGENVYEVPRAGVRQFSAEQQAGLDMRIAAAARHGFQYRYETIRVPDDADARSNSGSLLDAFVAFLSSPPALDFFRAVTGADDLAFADGQATSYGPGHFLTRHDDDVAGKHRRAAYVFGLAAEWRAEWGGLLMFHRDDGSVAETYAPAMGTLRLFSVPVQHSVSYVTPFAPEPRLSVTGWLRARPQSTA